ncbi:hypothetical protein V6L76_07825 [Pannonibacter sp. Pt2]|uniref:EF-hand domain-containing protein n=1 Tax=Pannonibacter anstelovis TaxID=3121537 RepID=A0ABU7ZLN4_9HYPH
MIRHGFAFTVIAALAFQPLALAQNTVRPSQGAEPLTGRDAAQVDCEAQFDAFDLDGDGSLSQSEAARDAARTMIDGIVIGEQGLTRDQFLEVCDSHTWSQSTPESGAPFEGSNSFTEEQARERAAASNVSNVSPLTLDDQGIWRGTGTVDGQPVSVAVDYRGNVVTTPAAQ